MDNDIKAIQEKLILRINLFGILVNVLLGIGKIVIGFFSGSMALLSDGIHSFSDLVTDAAVILGTKLSSREPDHKHPYGHEWYNTFASLFIAIVLFLLGCAMIAKSALSIVNHEVEDVRPIAIWVAIASIISKEWLYRKTRAVAKRTHSAALYANAWHHRSDAFSSVAVLVGLISLRLGFEYGDRFATAAVGFMMILAAMKVLESCIREFADCAVDQDIIDEIETVISSNKHIKQWHKLRTRSVGRELFLDLHILVDPDISVTLAHEISDNLEDDLRSHMQRPMNIIVHIEPDLPHFRKD